MAANPGNWTPASSPSTLLNSGPGFQLKLHRLPACGPLTMRHYLSKPATRALTPTGGFLKGFAFSLNPYIGCAFGAAGGCPFCYVRMLPVSQAEKTGWGNWVIAKSNLPELLEHELLALEKKDRLKD